VLVIREFRIENDLQAVVALLVDVYPQNLITRETFAHWVRNEPVRARRRRWIAEEDGTVVGWSRGGLNVTAARDDVAYVGVAVAPPARRRGIGAALYDAAEAHVLGLGARKLLSDSQDTDDARRFAERRGFRHTHTLRYSAVDPSTIDYAALRPLRERAERSGLRLAPMTEVPPEPVWVADIETTRDMPSDEPFTTMPFHEWKPMYWDNPLFARDASFVVLDGDRVVSLTMLRIDDATRRAGTDMTGTRREYRGRGLARLVKLASLRRAADRGVTRVVTDNDEQNAPMLAVNRRLGFVPYTAMLTWVRE
jgi:GNAT superfamily N-acetyltransferase